MTEKRADYLAKFQRGEVNIFRFMQYASVGELCQFLTRPEENVRNFAKQRMRELEAEEEV